MVKNTMGDGQSEKFDLPMLLKLDNLDIRGVASKDLSLRAGEYFDLLSKFIIREPEVTNALYKIAALDSDENTFHTLADFRSLLDDIGCNIFTIAFTEIIDAGRINDRLFSSTCAKKVLHDFYELHMRIMTAKKTETADIAPDSDGPPGEKPAESYEMQTLYKALKMLDHQEATRKLQILVIDDSPVMLKTISSVLSDEYKVHGLSNPAMVEKFLDQITPELFLLDYQMPQLSGFDLVPIIRSFREHKDTPIIFITSQGTTDHVSAALALGACDFIVKPFQGNTLRERIAKHIVRKKLF